MILKQQPWRPELLRSTPLASSRHLAKYLMTWYRRAPRCHRCDSAYKGRLQLLLCSCDYLFHFMSPVSRAPGTQNQPIRLLIIRLRSPPPTRLSFPKSYYVDDMTAYAPEQQRVAAHKHSPSPHARPLGGAAVGAKHASRARSSKQAPPAEAGAAAERAVPRVSPR